ncbi:MAG: flagellar FlbD family protein [bacterium]|nr:flagellar FlbD family protein [bacterium]
MVELTKLNGAKLVVNADMIEFIEALPDSLITLTTGTKIMVKEKIPEIIAAVVEFRKRTREGPATRTIPTAETGPGTEQE